MLSVAPLPSAGLFQVSVSVTRAWKSNTTEEVSFITGSDCKYDVAPGDHQLLFLVQTPDGHLTTGRCMGNTPSVSAKPVLTWLAKHGVRGRIDAG
ncbi:MAG: hypothetical protein JWN48_4593 [Myxococcaceae bacterium]|nr:hypothetical protein [Myxococcaceae bacterium]